MHYSQEQLDELAAVARAATPGQWLWGPTPTKTVNAAVRWVAKMIRASTSPAIWEVYAGTPDQPRATAITGNGPDSERNAAYIVSAQPETVLNLIEDLSAAQADAAALRNGIVDYLECPTCHGGGIHWTDVLGEAEPEQCDRRNVLDVLIAADHPGTPL